MTERLRDHPDDLDALVTQTASAGGLPAAYVEKDFWVTEILRAAAIDRTVPMPDGSTSTVTFLFKGGTSLSRVFGIVDRFSEDVDLLSPCSPRGHHSTRATRCSSRSTPTSPPTSV
ncbi:MAG: nucleotidyl transferase AbiEii/AbiGii toxin family protein [Nocardioides sp.]|uniref:nucleotidyl transferase AbiEii/AbiGii toxin family protein n=1 Tax=Nocardioides sp. TaxID=35761 RepID=UPI0039E21A77